MRYCAEGKLVRFTSSLDIVKMFVLERQPMYGIRYDLILVRLRQQALLHKSVARFCRLVLVCFSKRGCKGCRMGSWCC